MTYIPDPAGRGRPQPRGGERLARLATEAAGASSPGAALRCVRALRRELDDFEREQAAGALAEGASSAAVGRARGLSRRAAHRRFRGVAVAGPDEPPLLLTAAARLAFRHAREEA